MPTGDHRRSAVAEGRRALDLAPLLRWLPFLSLLTFMIAQTVYVTRYVSGIESTNTQLIATVSDLKVEMKALSLTVNQAAVPSATSNLRLDYLEARINELRGALNDNSRRLTQIESMRAR